MLHQWTMTPEGRLRTEIDGAVYEIVERPRVGAGESLYDVVEVTAGGYGWFEQTVEGLDAAKAEAADHALHRRELAALRRTARKPGSAEETPWGGSQSVTVYDEGVELHATASHGGFRLSPERNAAVPEAFRRADGWYEEDIDCAAVALAFPQLFTGRERRVADAVARNWRPDAYEAWSGRTLEPGESNVKDRNAYLAAHAVDWLAISARRSPEDVGTVVVTASLGGKRGGNVETKEFLVPASEYTTGRPFLIDPARHPEAGEAGSAPRP